MNPDQKYRYNFIFRIFLICVVIFMTGRNGMTQYDHQVLENVAGSSEKVYVQLDKMVYVAGSTVRFRAFLVNADLLQHEVRSKILYLELAGPEINQPVMWRINLNDGNCYGSFALPYELKSGIYSLRAYTNWMKNGKPDYLFSADILIIEISEEIPGTFSIYAEPVSDRRIITFYPESGQLIDGVPCRVGYKVSFKIDGMLPDSIKIVEEDSIIVTQIKTGQLGFGSFDFLPDIRKSYLAELHYLKGQKIRVPVPYIETYGYCIQAEEVEGGLNVSINGKSMTGNQQVSFRLVVASHGRILLDYFYPASGSIRNVFIPSVDLDRGILNLTLYDSRRFVLSQRLYYYNFIESGPEIKIEGTQNSYSNGEEVRMELHVDGLAEGDTVSLAVSVAEQHPFQHVIQPVQIDDYFFLLSELSKESMFYSNPGEISEQQIQNLLLCLDRNDYALNYYSGAKLPECVYDLEDNGYILKGTVRKKTENEPLTNANIIINVMDSISTRILYAPADLNGNFYAVLNSFYDNRNIIMQVLEDFDNMDIVWEIEGKRLPEISQRTNSYTLTDKEQDFIGQSIDIRIIEAVYEDSLKDFSPVKNANKEMLFFSPNTVVYPADYAEMNSFREIVENILPAVRFTTRNQQFKTGVYDKSSETWLENDMVFLNGVMFKDLAYIAMLGSKDIERIEIHNTSLMSGEMTIPGFLSIYTYDGLVPESYLSDHAYIFVNDVLPEGHDLQLARPETDTYPDTEHPDLRQTLFWAPDIKISGSDTVAIKFQTSQLDGLYDINIQGISRQGIPMHKNFVFSVK
ncbi:MAG: hypothetical protein JXB19_03375 [Bacteroidales bacterium]|nr:hypothetical protein [Bacteroidales bacterium]